MFNNRLGNRWWFYYALDWSDVLLRTEIINRDLGALTIQEPYHTAIFTKCVRNGTFGIPDSSPTQCAFPYSSSYGLCVTGVDLQRYLNVTIYPCFNQYNFETVFGENRFLS